MPLYSSTGPIRVLQVVTIMNRAGLETMLMNYYRTIDRSKVQFDFLVHRKEAGAYDDEIRALGGKIYQLPPITLTTLSSYQDLAVAFFKQHPYYKIVHSHLDALSSLPLRAAQSVGVPVRIAHGHNNNFAVDLKFPMRMILKKSIHRYATDYMGCSPEALQFMFGKYGEQGVVLKNAIDTSKFVFNSSTRNTVREQLKLTDEFVVGHVGRFSAQKNHMFLLEVFSQLLKRRPNSILILIGEGQLQEKVEKRAKELHIEGKLLFMKSQNNVNELMQAMDVFVLPSLFEGLGIVLIEAQAAGLSCLTSQGVVSEETRVTELIHYLPLKDGAARWAEAVENMYVERKDRKDMSKEIVSSGFEIKRNAQWLQTYYLNKLASK
ncbi:glycosyltransferase family 1 protein [Bittarella massiliensis (ex Durand et al. 2017)]|uniref:glycosyltransferase family 1 protein n=1 Tax=Bittarella massiliensis (ex Durand et al. 2017) TaxID=1720313 RepID=UPI000AB6825C|nr:glycosyltransferase family 1 protein [Bittarella massiliensis (ex Durand et al. 2017)]